MKLFRELKSMIWVHRHPISQSRHREDYEEIAHICGSDVGRVYRLAHGSHVRSHTDSLVVSELVRREILSN